VTKGMKYTTPRQAAARLEQRLDSIYALLWAGRLRGARKVDGRRLIPTAAVDAKLKARSL
jgi:hypothetical protein